MKEIIRMIVVTTIISAFSAAWLGALNKGLEKRIIKQEDIYIRGPAIKELLAGAPNDPLSDRIIIKDGEKEIAVYPWIENGRIKRIAVEWAGKGGYGGDVIVMTAVDLSNYKITGVKVTQHKETPGVGTRAMTPSYLRRQYKGLYAKTKIRLKKDGGQIDAVSGATHSSEAIADAVNKATKFILAHKDEIIKEIKRQ
ncbi:MAG: electron transporter RnfG [Deltaproteobacteria bacterium]|nr:MAG: electron transporter RnfG [Deltaproteobacteria bacterium]